MFEHGYALIIGVGKYKIQGLSVSSTAKDAEDVRSTLINRKYSGYKEENVLCLSNSDATCSKIIDAFGVIRKKIMNDSLATLIVLFSGHGQKVDNEYYLLTHETELLNTGYGLVVNPDTALSNATLVENIKSVNSQRTVVFLNTCFSGSAGTSLNLDSHINLSPIPLDAFDVLLNGEGKIVISSSKFDQKSWIKASDRNSIFIKHLLLGLQGGAFKGGEFIGVFDLFNYISNEVPKDAQSIDAFQTPIMKAYDITKDFPLTLAPANTSANALIELSEKDLWLFLTNSLNSMLDSQVDNIMQLVFSIAEINSIGEKTRINYLIALRRLGRLHKLQSYIFDLYPEAYSQSLKMFK